MRIQQLLTRPLRSGLRINSPGLGTRVIGYSPISAAALARQLRSPVEIDQVAASWLLCRGNSERIVYFCLFIVFFFWIAVWGFNWGLLLLGC
jgi:hypothetical protein